MKLWPIVFGLLATGAGVAMADPVVTAATHAPNPMDWLGLVKDAGAVGVLVWMVFYFQARAKEDKTDLKNLTERAISALEKNAEGNRELAVSIEKLSSRMGVK